MSAARAAAELAVVGDDRVMASLQDGCVDAFEVLYDRYRDRAYAIARSVCRDHGRAEEAVQEAFVSIWRTCVSYEPQAGTVGPWVLTVVRHRAIDIARRNGSHAARWAGDDALHAVPASGGVAEHVLERAQARDLRALLAILPEAQRDVIALAFYGQLTHNEIAAHLDLPAGTVKGRMRLGLQRLRGDIERVVAS